jgi:hypothetical protein
LLDIFKRLSFCDAATMKKKKNVNCNMLCILSNTFLIFNK